MNWFKTKLSKYATKMSAKATFYETKRYGHYNNKWRLYRGLENLLYYLHFLGTVD